MSLKFLALFAFLIIQVSCDEKGSLAFIIDDTASFTEELLQIKFGAKKMLETILADDSIPIQDVVVVTFNDPEVKFRTKTRDRRLLRKAMELIVPHGGNDCPELSLTGIKKGLEESQPGSNLYVFTDASAKDYPKFEEIKSLCQEKKSKITFVLTGNCEDGNSQMDEVYNDIAAACGGDVLRIKKDQVPEVVEYITEFLQVANNLTLSQKIPSSQWTQIKFRKDFSTDYFLVSASGTDVRLSVEDQEGNIANAPGRLSNFNVLKLDDLAPGDVTVTVRSATNGRVVVYGHTARSRWPTLRIGSDEESL